MKTNKILLLIFSTILIISAIGFILYTQNIFNTEEEYKFHVQLYDTFDAFRGNYINITLIPNSFGSNTTFKRNSYVYGLIGTDENGFATISNISSTKHNEKCVKMKVENSYNNYYYYSEKPSINTHENSIAEEYITNVDMNFPFYMNEDFSAKAEQVYRENTDNIYVTAIIKNNTLMIKNIYIKDIPLNDYLKS